MCICVYVYVSVFVCVCVWMCVCMCVLVCMCVCMCGHMDVCMYMFGCMDVCMYMYVCLYVWVYACVYVYVCVFVCVGVWMCAVGFPKSVTAPAPPVILCHFQCTVKHCWFYSVALMATLLNRTILKPLWESIAKSGNCSPNWTHTELRLQLTQRLSGVNSSVYDKIMTMHFSPDELIHDLVHPSSLSFVCLLLI